jgi:xanthine dehydrogenase accessory factor
MINTLGGGQLEYQAIDEAQAFLAQHGSNQAIEPYTKRYPLGPSLGQCCGGVVHLNYTVIDASNLAELEVKLRQHEPALALFGAGHVGKALIDVMSKLPWQVTWIDSRDNIFPMSVPSAVKVEHSEPVAFAVDHLQESSHVLIMSFSHAEDLDIVARCLLKARSGFHFSSIGLIGSETKWATFQHRLIERGFTQEELRRVRCPIGLPGIEGKEPEVIAVAVVAQLLLDESCEQVAVL